uniref:uncharacterized protein n=1 Tax=Myxine glutinosa TaxID=7769 RepID=UPI00358E8AEA
MALFHFALQVPTNGDPTHVLTHVREVEQHIAQVPTHGDPTHVLTHVREVEQHIAQVPTHDDPTHVLTHVHEAQQHIAQVPTHGDPTHVLTHVREAEQHIAQVPTHGDPTHVLTHVREVEQHIAQVPTQHNGDPTHLLTHVREAEQQVSQVNDGGHSSIAARPVRRPTCALCHRNGTELFDFVEHPIPDNIVRRKHGDMPNINADAVVCWHCHQYINRDTNIHAKNAWLFAWPAVLWTYLSGKKPVDPSKFSALLSDELREMWKQMLLDNDVSRPVKQALAAKKPIFTDITKQLREFDHMLHVDGPRLLQMQTLLNKTAFPTVVCPMGCNLFVDDLLWERAELLPLHHYLKTFIPSFNGFKADATYLTGARPNWPYKTKDLKWYVSPALVMDTTRGLCLVTCSKSVHAGGDHQYLHVPTHPILGHIPTTYPDHMAPAVVTPNFVRVGHTRQYNTSYNVVKQQGDGRGLSTFSLRTKSPRGTMQQHESQACSLTLHERSDVRHFMCQSQTYGRKYVRNVMQRFPPPVQQHVAKHSRSGTYIHVGDAYEMAKAFHSRQTVIGEEAEDNDARQQQVAADDDVRSKTDGTAACLVVVHSVQHKGHPPFNVPYVQRRRPHCDYSAGRALVCALHCIVHCRPLHRLLVRATLQLRADPIIITLQSLCVRLCNYMQGTFINQYPSPKLLAIDASVENAYLQPHHTLVERKIATLLCHHCSRVSHHHLHRNEDIDVSTILSAADNDVVILTRHVYTTEAEHTGAARRIRVAELPLQSADTKWSLLLALTVHSPVETPYTVDVAFRWTSTHGWQNLTTAQTEAPAPVHDVGKMALVIYARDNSDNSLARNEAINWCGGQTKLRCANHPDILLIREHGKTGYRCCYGHCKTPLRWRCPHGIPKYQCDTGLCLKHAKQLLRDDAACGLIRQRDDADTDDLPVQGEGGASINDDRNVPGAAADDLRNPVMMPGDVIDPEDEPQDAVEAADMYVIAGDDFPDDAPTLTTSSTLVPLYMSETSHATLSTLGHFVLNDYLRVMTRASYARKPAVATQQVLQHICAVTPGDTIPLLYPEGVLFPTIFWSSVGQSIIGALPSALYTKLERRHGGQTATLQDHMCVRLRDNSLLTSHDCEYLQWTFDVLLNHQLNYNSAVVAVKKGLEHLRPPNIGFSSNTETCMKFDELDGRQQVNRLAALMKDMGGFDYFITATCNDSKTFGVAPITRAIEELYRRNFKNPHHVNVEHIHQSYCVIMCRAWERTSRYFLHWLEHSPEQPCGEVQTLWARYEFQSTGSPGNRPHIHGFLKVKNEDEKTKLSRIRCQISHIFSKSARMTMRCLLEDGFVETFEDYCDMYALCMKVQVHDCSHAQNRCQRKMANGTWKCRVQQHPPSFEYDFDERPNLYDPDVLKLLEELGLAKRDVFGRLKVPRTLAGGKYTYPAQPKETFVPTIPRFWLALQSCTNVQLCDTRFQVAYVCKYAAGVDEKRQADFKSTSSSSEDMPHDTVDVRLGDLSNTKTSGQTMKTTKPGGEHMAKEIGLPEMMWHSLRLPFITTNVEYTHVSTQAPEYRSAVTKRRGGQHVDDIAGGAGAAGGTPEAVQARRGLPAWRQFTYNQTIVIQQLLDGYYYLDSTWKFSVRPPELMLFDDLHSYSRWFCMKTCKRYDIDADLASCPWISGNTQRIRLRQAHVKDAVAFVEQQRQSDIPSRAEQAAQMYRAIFAPLQAEHDGAAGGEKSNFYHKFVDVTKVQNNIVVFTAVTPFVLPSFLVHLLLSMGKFNTEVDLYSCPELKSAFVKAGLIPDGVTDVASIHQLARRYIEEQLMWLPIGTRQFQRILRVVVAGLKRFFLDGDFIYEAMPLATDAAISETANAQLQQLETSRRHAAVDALSLQNLPNFPDPAALKSGIPVHYSPVLQQAENQSDESLEEQRIALGNAVAAIDALQHTGDASVRFPLFVGGPGAGKTFLLLVSQVYAMSLGFNTLLVAYTSERARCLGGEHLHLITGMPVVDLGTRTVRRIAEQCLHNLARSPLKMQALRRIKIMFVEEIGLIPGELFAVLDMVMRKLNASPVPFGGTLIVATGDHHQLAPIKGQAIWTSCYMLTTFRILILQHYVRCSRDHQLRRLIEMMRRNNLGDADIDEFCNIMRRRCVPRQFVQTWTEVPADVLRVFGKKQAVDVAVEQFLKNKRSDRTLHSATISYSCMKVQLCG